MVVAFWSIFDACSLTVVCNPSAVSSSSATLLEVVCPTCATSSTRAVMESAFCVNSVLVA